MSVLSWNYCGLGEPHTVQMLVELVKCKKPNFLFLIKTMCNKTKLESLKVKLGYEGLFTVDPTGQSGGLALYWKSSSKVSLQKFSRNYIDVVVEDQNLGS